jgi:hypothetical protein
MDSGNACYHTVQIFRFQVSYIKSQGLKREENYNFISCHVWVWNLVSHSIQELPLKDFDNRVLIKSVLSLGRRNRRLEKIP